mgnify:FL=1
MTIEEIEKNTLKLIAKLWFDFDKFFHSDLNAGSCGVQEESETASKALSSSCLEWFDEIL